MLEINVTNQKSIKKLNFIDNKSQDESDGPPQRSIENSVKYLR